MQFLFRADASGTIGSGHVMRCLALAEALHAEGHACSFAMAEPSAAIERRLAHAGVAIHRINLALDANAAATQALLRAVGASAVIVDGYHFDEQWRIALRGAGLPVLAFSDPPYAIPPHADIVVDAAGTPAPQSDAVERLFGPDFVLLRRELIDAAWQKPLPMAQRPSILVTFGGSDPAGLTLPVTRALIERLGPAVPFDVVVGGGVVNGIDVTTAAQALGSQVTTHIDPPVLGQLMRSAGLAVSAGGNTVGELAAIGVPAIIAVIVRNQEEGAAAAVAGGWAEAIDARVSGAIDRLAEATAVLWADPAERAQRVILARRGVDAGGSARVAAALLRQVARQGV